MASQPATNRLGYRPLHDFLDEVFRRGGGAPAAHAGELVAALEQMGPAS